jgi:3-oxoacyl-[acyl-carrier protein] reductase
MAGRLEGRVALVTGGSRGIGRATVEIFGREGAAVVVNYAAREEDARQVVGAIVNAGGQATAIQANVASRTEVEAMAARTLEHLGKIDILVNNAGIFQGGNTLELAEDSLDQLMAVNLKGVINCVQAVAPRMIERGYGKIVNVSSVAGLITSLPNTTPYAMTKAAVIALTKRLAMELGPHGINVNAICPGQIETDMAPADPEAVEAMVKKTILGRRGRPEDIAHSALYLASDEAAYVTAQVLTVDGGRMDFLSHGG